MLQLKRRGFLQGLGVVGTGILSSNNTWALNRLEPIKNTLQAEYPYRSWEDLYRNEWT